MAWNQPVNPKDLYERRESVSGILAPTRFDPLPSDSSFPSQYLAVGITSVLSLVSARPELWAATCIATGYASHSNADPAGAMYELAVTTTDTWTKSGVSEFSAAYGNLGWEPLALIRSAQMLSAAIPYPLFILASFTVADVEACFDVHGNDMSAVAECLKEAASARARLGQ
jgi:hypothetical protein